jgi:hypothetical protein
MLGFLERVFADHVTSEEVVIVPQQFVHLLDSGREAEKSPSLLQTGVLARNADISKPLHRVVDGVLGGLEELFLASDKQTIGILQCQLTSSVALRYCPNRLDVGLDRSRRSFSASWTLGWWKATTTVTNSDFGKPVFLVLPHCADANVKNVARSQ